MTMYTWEGTEESGKKLRGEMDALSPQHVYNALRAQKILPNTRRIRPKNSGLSREITIPGLKATVKLREIVLFTRQFATMIDAGLPLIQGLETIGRKHENKAMRAILLDVKEQVQSGSTLAQALKRHPETFDELFTNMVAAGETGGVLDIILERLASYLEKLSRLKSQIKTAMIYPAVVVSAAVLVTSILLIFVIPTFSDLFKDFGAELPAPTLIVIAVSDFFVAWWHLLLGSLVASLVLIRRLSKIPRGKAIIDPLLLKTPIFGSIIRKVGVARFSRTLGTMLSSGVPILEALQICAKTANNSVIEREVNRIRASISEGGSLVDPLTDSPVFPDMVVQMIRVGESTGALDAMLNKIADFTEEEVDNAVQAMKQLIEPVMIVILGTIIGALVVAMYLPIFKLGTVM